MGRYLDDAFFSFDDLETSAEPNVANYGGGDPTKITKDPAFIQDLKDYYRAQGERVGALSDEALLDKFYGDRNWAELNTVGIAADAARAYGMDEDQRARAARLQTAWSNLPNMFQKGGRGLGAVPDVAVSLLADPTNLLGFGAAKGTAMATSRAAVLAGKSSTKAVIQGTKKGALKAAMVEGGIGAGVEAGANIATQKRDQALGLQDEFSFGQLGAATAFGGGLGGVAGGVMNAPAAFAGAREGAKFVDDMRELGIPDERIARIGNDGQKVLGAKGDKGDIARGDYRTELNPEIVAGRVAQDLEDTIAEQQAAITAMQGDGLDVTDAQQKLTSLSKLRGVIAGLEQDAAEIVGMGQAAGSARKAAARRTSVENELARLKGIIERDDDAEIAEATKQAEEFRAARDQEEAQDLEDETAAQAEQETVAQGATDETGEAAPPAAAQPKEKPKSVNTEMGTKGGTRPGLMPSVADLAARFGLTEEDLDQITGSHKSGRVTADDLRNWADENGQQLHKTPEEAAEARAKKVAEAGTNGTNEDETGDPFPITSTARKRAEEAGIDWRKIVPANGEQINAADIKAAKKAAKENGGTQPTAEAPATPNADVKVPDPTKLPGTKLTENLKRHALAKGVDWRAAVQARPDLEPAQAVRHALNERFTANKSGAAIPEDNTVTELQGAVEKAMAILRQSPSIKTEADLKKAVTALSKTEEFEDFADDLPRYLDIVMDAANKHGLLYDEPVDLFPDVELTGPQQARARKFAEQIKAENPNVTDEGIINMAKNRVVQQGRGAPEASDIKGAGERAASNIYKEAGRNVQGGIQNFLKRSFAIAKGSDYGIGGDVDYPQTWKFNGQEAAQRAKDGTDGPVVSFIATGKETVLGRGKRGTVEPGTVIYANGASLDSGKYFATEARALKAMGLKKEALEIEAEPEITKQYAGGPRDDNQGTFARPTGWDRMASDSARKLAEERQLDPNVIKGTARHGKVKYKDVQAYLENPEANTIDPETGASEFDEFAAQAGSDEALGKALLNQDDNRPAPMDAEGKLLIMRNRDSGEVRMMSVTQHNNGATIDNLLGKSDPAKWDVAYADPARFTTNKKKLRKVWSDLEDDAKTAEQAKAETAQNSGRGEDYIGEPFTPDGPPPRDLDEVKELTATLSAEDADAINELMAEIKRPVQLAEGMDMSMQLVQGAILQAEVADWTVPLATRRRALTALYGLRSRTVPEGIIYDPQTRAQAISDVFNIFGKYDPEVAAEGAALIEKLGGNAEIGPRFAASREFDNSALYTSETGEQTIQLKTPGKPIRGKLDGINPMLHDLYHEVAHWAYHAILTDADRVEFWKAMEKYDGKEAEFLADHLARLPDAKMNSNAVESPQELFAEQFVMWVTRNRDTALQDEGYWQRMVGYVKAIFDRFVRGAQIDPDLEPLFARILPDDLEAAERRIVEITLEPASEQGKHIKKRLMDLNHHRDQLEEALTGGNPESIVNAFRSLQRDFLLSMAPRGKDANVFQPVRKLVPLMHDRVKDIDEILGIKGQGGNFDDGAKELDTIIDFEAMDKAADVLLEYYELGRETQKFQFDRATKKASAQAENTSILKALNTIEITLKRAYGDAEHGADPAGIKVRSAAPRTLKTPGAPQSKTKRMALRKLSRKEKAALRQADELMREANRPRVKVRGTPKAHEIPKTGTPVLRREEGSNIEGANLTKFRLDAPAMPSPFGDDVPGRVARAAAREFAAAQDSRQFARIGRMNTSELINFVIDKAGIAPTDGRPLGRGEHVHYAAQLLVQRVNARPQMTNVVPRVPAGEAPIHNLTVPQLQDRLYGALNDGNRELVDVILARLDTKRPSPDAPFLAPIKQESRTAIRREVEDNAAPQEELGIPAMAPAPVRDMLSKMTHRDPQVAYTLRTMTYRMLNLLGKTARDAVENTTVMTNAEMARLAGVEPSSIGPAAFADFSSPEFTKLRSDQRRLAVSLTKGKVDPLDVMHEVGHVVLRSGALPDGEMNAITTAYRMADGQVKARIQKLYGGKYAERPDDIRDTLLAEEWFAEEFAKYAAERVARGTIYDTLGAGQVDDITLRGRFETALDRMVEYVAYVTNGLIGRKDIKQTFRRLTLFGDMTAPKASASLDAGKTRVTVPASLAPTYAADVLRNSPKARQARIEDFVGRGYGAKADGTPVVFYHGTPNGAALKDRGTVVKMSERGGFGPGFYITADPRPADQVYAKTATPDAMREQIIRKNPDMTEDEIADVEDALADLHDVRLSLAKTRRAVAATIQDADSSDEVTQFLALEELPNKMALAQQFAELEMEMSERLADWGFVGDPYVAPVYIRLLNPADFRRFTPFAGMEDFAQGLQDELVKRGTLSSEASARIVAQAEQTDSMHDYYRRLANAADVDINAAKADINAALKNMGYDGMLTTHVNSVNADGSSTIPRREDMTFAAQTITHDAPVVFSPNQVKHIEAADFDQNLDGLYQRERVEPDVVAALTEAVSQGSITSMKDVAPGSVAALVEDRGTSTSLGSTLMNMLRGRDLQPHEQKVMWEHGPSGWLKSQAGQMRKMGMNWLADWYEPHFSDAQQAFAKRYWPLHRAMAALPDTDGAFRHWFRASTGSLGQEQPKSHTRIVKALRRPSGSDMEKRLTTQERAVYMQIREALRKERQTLVDLGVSMGDRGDDYWPQIWSDKAIMAKPEDFKTAMANYRQIEAEKNGEELLPEDALAFADRMYKRLTHEDTDGVFIPLASGGSRNPQSDNMDFARMIQLDQHPEALQALEPFLEKDLGATLAKYFEGTSRRATFVDQMGVNSHALYDYLMVVDQGSQGIVRLLSSNKVFTRDVNVLGEEGVEKMHIETMVPMPFAGKEPAAAGFVTDLIEAHVAGGPAASRSKLMAIAPKTSAGNIPLAYTRRVEAIIGALNDYKGQRMSIQNPDLNAVEESFRVAMRKRRRGVSDTGAKISNGLRSINSISLLGFTTLTSLGDPALSLIHGGSFRAWLKGMKSFASDPEYRDLLAGTGVAIENILHERMLHLYGGADTKFSNAFFNATMLTPWTDMQRKIAAAVGHETFKAMQAKAKKHYKEGLPLAEQPRAYKTAHRMLSSHGLQDFLPSGRRGNESLGSTKLLESDDMVRQALIRFADKAIFTPNANDIPLWAQTPVGALAFQLKSFPLMMGKLSAEVLNETKHGNFKPLLYLLSVGPAFGAGALAVKDVVQFRGGEEGKDPELRKRNILQTLGYNKDVHGGEDDFLGWYVEGLLTMGGFGLIGDIAFTLGTQADNGAYGQTRVVSMLGGPTAGLGLATMNVMGGAKEAIVDGSGGNAKERTAVREIANRVPVLGGIRRVREGLVDAVAGEADDGKGLGGAGFGGNFGGF